VSLTLTEIEAANTNLHGCTQTKRDSTYKCVQYPYSLKPRLKTKQGNTVTNSNSRLISRSCRFHQLRLWVVPFVAPSIFRSALGAPISLMGPGYSPALRGLREIGIKSHVPSRPHPLMEAPVVCRAVKTRHPAECMRGNVRAFTIRRQAALCVRRNPLSTLMEARRELYTRDGSRASQEACGERNDERQKVSYWRIQVRRGLTAKPRNLEGVAPLRFQPLFTEI
jgi:hypothetical protein